MYCKVIFNIYILKTSLTGSYLLACPRALQIIEPALDPALLPHAAKNRKGIDSYHTMTASSLLNFQIYKGKRLESNSLINSSKI
jgi:hypothetical protein